jgi:hypothetical protein
MKEEIKQLQEKAREELEKELDKHLYTCADYEISSDKIDNEILKTTGDSIKKEILERQNTLIEQSYKQGREDIIEMIKWQVSDLRNAKIDHPVRVEWNDALEQSACKLEALIKTQSC